MRRKSVLALAGFVLVSLSIEAQTASKSAAPAGPSLYKRLGGYDAIAAVSDVHRQDGGEQRRSPVSWSD
jgi:hypothetical protein